MDRMQLLDLMDGALNEAELTDLSRQLAVNFAAFPGHTKRDRTREFLAYVHRHGRADGLAEAIVAVRPDLAVAVAHLYKEDDPELAWLDQMAGGTGAAASGVTWRWATDDNAPAKADVLAPLFADGEADFVPPLPNPPPQGEGTRPPRPVGEGWGEGSTPANPYTPGRSVADEAMFFGRAAELAAIGQHLAAGEHVAIVGARTFGASSLLARAAGQVSGAPALVAVVDLKAPALQTLPGLLSAIWTQWWAGVRPGNVTPVRTLVEFDTAARKLHAAGFRPLLFIDELEQLAWRPAVFSDGLLDAWLVLGRAGAITFATTVHVAPAELLAQAGYRSRFYELFRQLDLGLLDGDAARTLLSEPISRAGLALPAGAVDELLALAGPQPFYLQLAGLYLYEAAAGAGFAPDEVARRFGAAAAPHWQELWESLSPLAQNHYPVERVGAASGMAGRQQRILANRGLLIADEDGRRPVDGFRPFSDGFAGWLRRQRVAGEAAAIKKDEHH